MSGDVSADSNAVWQEYRFSAAELDVLRAIVLDRVGINIGPEKDYLLASRFGKMLKYNNLANAADLIASLRRYPENADKAIASFLTTGHTFFFRESAHFGLLVMLLRKSGLASPKIWCAATSSGEELYSIAISLLEAGLDDFTLLGSDINPDALKACRRGIYHSQRLLEVSPDILKRYFVPVPLAENRAYQISKPIRDRAILRRINLLDHYRWEQKLDVVFCRNVLIYFDETTQQRVLTQLLGNLEPHGYLFLGHSEPLLTNQYRLQSIAPAVYQQRVRP